MTTNVSDSELRQLLNGKLSPSEELRLENQIAQDAQLRSRLERLSGGDAWPVGSAPIPVLHNSDQLSKAIELVGRYLSRTASAELAVKNTALPAPEDIDPPNISGITLVREIGRGGMGIVYQGIDETLGRRVAVKFIEPLRATSAEIRERFLREARSAAALQHENIVSIYSIQNLNGRAALVQQYIDGCTLQQRVDREGPLPIEDCMDLARQLARGLIAAHAAGIVHRDLKPGNVLLEKETKIARIADFGMARNVADSKLTLPDVVVGTPKYMSPEQTMGQPTDERSDLFSLGSILFTITTGHIPFQGDDPFAVMHSVRHSRVPRVQQLRPEVPVWFSQIIERLLAKQPDRRIQSAGELLNMLETRSAPSSHWPHPAWLVAATAIVLSFAIVIYQVSWSASTDGTTTPAAAKAVGPKPATGTRVISIQGQTQEFSTLARAVENAQDGDTILIAEDLETEGVEIVGKRLTIAAAPNCRPQLRPSEWAKEHSPVLFRTDADLTIRGLVMDWNVKTDAPVTIGGKVNAVVVTARNSNANLSLDDCSVFRNGAGICIGVTGDLMMDHCWIGNGEIAVAWSANESRIQISNSVLQCATSVSVISPSPNVLVKKVSQLNMDHCSVVGDNLIGFVIARIPDRSIEVAMRNTVFDVHHIIILSATNNLNINLNAESPAIRMLRSCLKWQESSCVHSADITYLACRRMRVIDRVIYSGIGNLQDWTALWPNEPAQSPAVAGAVESKITSTIPANRRELPWSENHSVHEFDPPIKLKVGPSVARPALGGTP